MSKLTKYVLGALAAAAAIFLVWYFGNIVSYILISAVLAVMGQPLVKLLTGAKIRGYGIPKWLAALITLIVIWVVAVTFFSLFIPLVFNKLHEFARLDISQIVDTFRVPIARLENFLQSFLGTGSNPFNLTETFTEMLTGAMNIESLNSFLSSIISIIKSTAVALFSITFITYFFLKQDKLFATMVTAVFPSKYEENINRALDSVTHLLGRYFTGIIAESTIMMLAISLLLMLVWDFSASNAFFIGLIMGILNVIPYIGPLIGIGISVFVGIATESQGIPLGHTVLMVAGTILVVKGLDDFVLQPSLYSNRVKAHPLEIFIVILIAGSVAGVVGMLLAIPSYTVLRVFAKEFFYNFKLVRKLTENI